MTPATAILVPVLGRPWRVAPLIDSVEAATPEPHRLLFIVSEGDDDELDAIRRYFQEHGDSRPAPYLDWLVVPADRGTWAMKINAGYRATSEPFLFTGADDLDFQPGWLSAALTVAEETGAGVIGTNDQCNTRTINGEHSTHSLVRRSYADQCGTIDGPGILHEGYVHEYADDELVETALSRGCYAHSFNSVVRHLHPNCGGAPDDPTYVLGRQHTSRNARLFAARRYLWSGA